MDAVFFGTPEFAVLPLKTLIGAGHKVLAVVTQPDRQSGRGRNVSACPVKTEAQKTGLRILQPPKVRDAQFIEELKSIGPSVIVVAAYGQILPSAILRLPKYGCINIHASLLPAYRGAAPVNWAIINGESRTGVTTMLMDEGMDTGDILLQEDTDISPGDTAGTLLKKLSETGSSLLLPTLKGIEEGTVKPVPQTGPATYAPMLKKTDGLIHWERPAVELSNFIHGMNPWPGAYIFIQGERVKVLRAAAVEGEGEPGMIHSITKDKLLVGTGRGLLSLLEIQPAGRQAMPVTAFLQGRKVKEGMKFDIK